MIEVLFLWHVNLIKKKMLLSVTKHVIQDIMVSDQFAGVNVLKVHNSVEECVSIQVAAQII